ncbi:GroES-like protein [Thelephora ganbajun]|uniref:GroES-like protein n=1 Tax=Thelephora ganbajun TaxID=370292 RepID=A0ACB6Z9J0_THEGA|nr:GroES-like protein [Thelephora ganbajun]
MSNFEIPKTHRAVIVQADTTVKTEERLIPTVGENEILVKVSAIAINPTDWKHARRNTSPGTILGCDFAGVVVQVGPNLRVPVKVGNKVAASLRGGVDKERGGFAEYVKVYADLAWIIPEGTYTFEEAATIGIPLYTSVIALYGPNGLELPQPGDVNPPAAGTWLFVYGGSSSVGQYAIQLAKLSGYKVITTASKRNHKLVKSFGADLAFDYNDPDVVKNIKEATNGSIRLVYDTISEDYTYPLILGSITEEKSAKISVLHKPDPETVEKRQDIRWLETFIYTAYGPTVNTKNNEEERAVLSKFLWEKLPGLVRGGLKPNVIKEFDGGLDNVGVALDYLAQGKASGEKIVYTL